MSKVPHLVAAAAILFVAANETDEKPAIKVGDKLIVTAEGTDVRLGGKSVGTLSLGHNVRVTEIRDGWIGVQIEVEGKKVMGWVRAAHLASTRAVPVWARIILDPEISRPRDDEFWDGPLWKFYERFYEGAKRFDVVEGGPSWIGLGESPLGGRKITPDALRSKYGAAEVEVSSEGNDKGVTYYVYGPIAFGMKPGDKYFTWFRAQSSIYEKGFVETAVTALAKKVKRHNHSSTGGRADRAAQVLEILGACTVLQATLGSITEGTAVLDEFARCKKEKAILVRQMVPRLAAVHEGISPLMFRLKHDAGLRWNQVVHKIGPAEAEREDKVTFVEQGPFAVHIDLKWYRYGWLEVGVTDDGSIPVLRVDCRRYPKANGPIRDAGKKPFGKGAATGECERCGQEAFRSEEFYAKCERAGLVVDRLTGEVKARLGGFSMLGSMLDASAKINGQRRSQQEILEEIENRRGFRCTGCGRVYCMDCLFNHAPSHPGGGKACPKCRETFEVLD